MSPHYVGRRIICQHGLRPSRSLSLPGPLCPVAPVQALACAAPTWSPTGNLALQRYYHNAVPLLDGRVLVVGGSMGWTYFTTCYLYDPRADTWTQTGSLTRARKEFATVRLPDGDVLAIAGQGGGATIERYSPATGSWAPMASLAYERQRPKAVLLPTGKVLVAGGYNQNAPPVGWWPAYNTETCELFDPATNTTSPAASMAFTRSGHSLTLLANGSVLAAGGWNFGAVCWAAASHMAASDCMAGVAAGLPLACPPACMHNPTAAPGRCQFNCCSRPPETRQKCTTLAQTRGCASATWWRGATTTPPRCCPPARCCWRAQKTAAALRALPSCSTRPPTRSPPCQT